MAAKVSKVIILAEYGLGTCRGIPVNSYLNCTRLQVRSISKNSLICPWSFTHYVHWAMKYLVSDLSCRSLVKCLRIFSDPPIRLIFEFSTSLSCRIIMTRNPPVVGYMLQRRTSVVRLSAVNTRLFGGKKHGLKCP